MGWVCVVPIVAIFYPFSQFCEIGISSLSLQKQPKTAPNLFQRGVEYVYLLLLTLLIVLLLVSLLLFLLLLLVVVALALVVVVVVVVLAMTLGQS